MKKSIIKLAIGSALFMCFGSINAQITGSGNTGKIPKFTGSTSIGNSQIFDNGTNIGFGTTTPTQKFQFIGNGVFTLNLGGITNSAPLIQAGSSWSSASLPDYTWFGNTNTGIFHNAANMFGFSSNGIEVMRIHSNGKIGINTTNPTAQLTVNGTVLIGDPASVTLPVGYKLFVQSGILAEKVKVALTNTGDWADYVFNKDYRLKSLEEVKNYINENKHLPGVPSAEELKENGGFDVAKMDAKLLEKIEELTLYVIELNKKIEQQQKHIEELKKAAENK